MALTRLEGNAFGMLAVTLVAGAVFMAGCAGPEPPPAKPEAAVVKAAAPAEPAVVPQLSINALMVSWIDNAGHVLWDAEKKGFAPKDAADWLEIEDHATQLVAASTLLQLGGTGQADPGWVQQVGWKTSAQALGDAGLAAAAAAKGKHLEALVKANGTVVEACEGCHKAFKPQLPSEGLAHQRPHSDSHKSNH